MLKSGAELIAEERIRQIDKEGWSNEHDDNHGPFSMSTAGAVYALDLYKNDQILRVHNNVIADKVNEVEDIAWPWNGKWFKPTPDDPIRQLVKAGALIAAEIDRLQRLKLKDSIQNEHK